MNHDAIFVLSTGRCGTQWLHEAMQDAYGDAIAAEHEPLRADYQPRRFFRTTPNALAALGRIPAVFAHVERIRDELAHRPYFESGWPSFAALPWLHDALDGRMRIVHLTRHPVNAAFSMATHRIYGRDDWIREGAPTPFDAGCLDPSLQLRWPQMSAYEKCLFWWTELHRYAIDLHRTRPDIGWLRLSYESLFGAGSDELSRLAAFCGLPQRPELERRRARHTDRFRFRMPSDDWRKVMNCPKTLAVAEALGYAPADADARALSTRYFKRGRLQRCLSDWGLSGRREG
jgi:hypothetical protein